MRAHIVIEETYDTGGSCFAGVRKVFIGAGAEKAANDFVKGKKRDDWASYRVSSAEVEMVE